MRIHHATLAKAKKFQIILTVEDNEVVATDRKGTRLASGLQGNKVLEDAITKATGKPAKGTGRTATEIIASAKPARKPRAKKVEPHSEEEAEADMEDSDADQSKSIVKNKYKQAYKPHKDKCGDSLSVEINEHVVRENDAGEMRIDLGALRKFAKANGVWVESYASLKSRTGGWNAGMARMNCANRLRAKIRQAEKKGEKFEIEWA